MAGLTAALTHDVIHGLDFTTALGTGRRVPEERLRQVLATVTGDESRKHFGVDLTGIELRATDLDWSFGQRHPADGRGPGPGAGAVRAPAPGRAAVR